MLQVIHIDSAPHCLFHPGVTAFVNKLDCLLWTLALECDLGDRQRDVAKYAQQVICCLSDQGTYVASVSHFHRTKVV